MPRERQLDPDEELELEPADDISATTGESEDEWTTMKLDDFDLAVEDWLVSCASRLTMSLLRHVDMMRRCNTYGRVAHNMTKELSLASEHGLILTVSVILARQCDFTQGDMTTFDHRLLAAQEEYESKNKKNKKRREVEEVKVDVSGWGGDEEDGEGEGAPSLFCARCYSLTHYGRVKNETAETRLPEFDIGKKIGAKINLRRFRRSGASSIPCLC